MKFIKSPSISSHACDCHPVPSMSRYSNKNTINVTEILQKVERYNQLKNVELSAQIQQAQLQAKHEVDRLQSLLRLPSHDVMFNKAQIHDCPEIKSCQKLLDNFVNELIMSKQILKSQTNMHLSSRNRTRNLWRTSSLV